MAKNGKPRPLRLPCLRPHRHLNCCRCSTGECATCLIRPVPHVAIGWAVNPILSTRQTNKKKHQIWLREHGKSYNRSNGCGVVCDHETGSLYCSPYGLFPISLAIVSFARSLSWRFLSTLPGCLTYHELLPTLIVLATLDETCILKSRQKRKKNIKQNKCSVLVLASAQVAVATSTSRHATSFIQKLIVPVGLFRDQKNRGTDYLTFSLVLWRLEREIETGLIVSFLSCCCLVL